MGRLDPFNTAHIRREITTSAGAFRPESDNFGAQLSFHHPTLSSVRYPIPTQETGHALVTPLGLRVSMGGGDRLLSGALHDRMHFDI
ncbi:hypothetical protein EVAR_39970_1 [Eumeta japonica]|uniref:Uncharacterized protein n=1 Tax=Eumeta variegata TaxID=151549 RepID=A0A4C1X2I9_EUMVA|nr:hypothetical protein EVAR_39970_1 [Eumeta japonica]